MLSITLIIPVFNEVNNLVPLYRAVQAALSHLSRADSAYRFKLLFVDDGSQDNSLSLIHTLAELDDKVNWIALSRNFGKEAALSAGLDHVDSDTDAVILMDADLQHPPALIPQMIAVWQSELGCEGVYAEIAQRPHESWLKKHLTAFYYRCLQRLSKIPIPPHAGDFRLLSRRMVHALRTMREQHRYLKGLYAWVGFPQKAIPYTPAPRHAGATKFSYWKLFNLALEGITSFSTAPLKWAIYLGFLSAGSAFGYATYVIVKTLLFGEAIKGYPTLLIVMLLLGGIQLITLGILGEYLGRMFNETKQRPLYFIHASNLQHIGQYPSPNLEGYERLKAS